MRFCIDVHLFILVHVSLIAVFRFFDMLSYLYCFDVHLSVLVYAFFIVVLIFGTFIELENKMFDGGCNLLNQSGQSCFLICFLYFCSISN